MMENQAIDETTTQISDSSNNYVQSFRGVDGMTGVTLSEGDCFATSTDDNPWWKVEFGEMIYISQVHLLRLVEEEGKMSVTCKCAHLYNSYCVCYK